MRAMAPSERRRRSRRAIAEGESGHLLSKRVGGLAVVTLDEVQKRNVEAIEHRRQAAKFWHEGKRNCTQRARISLTVLVE